ncbi:MAG: beta-lactamase family protein [Lachnospiraceae bacterium]|nr:beta-lactamase family protein [Lachnospiraceae bacterium]
MNTIDYDKLTEYLDSIVGFGVPSVDLIVYEDHKQLYRHMAGTVDTGKKQKVAADQRYLMFSITKVQTMTAVMQLVEQGKLSLEDEVGKYLPAYKEVSVLGESKKYPILMKHLVSMQSGLDYDLGRPGILRVLKEKGDAATTRELVDSFVESPLKFIPGTHYEYSLSHDVAAAVIEVVSGMKFSEYLKKNIWEPLKMTDTFFAKPMNDGLERLAAQYTCIDNEKYVPMEYSCNYQLSESYESGGAGLVSCTMDYAKLADTLACGGISMDGVRILKPETVEKIKENLLSDASMDDLHNKMGRWGCGYGVGMVVLLDPESIGSPAPKGVFGWDGAAGSCITMDTGSKRSFVYTQHVRNMGRVYGEVHPKLRDMIFG